MHVRATHIRGLPVVEESSQLLLGMMDSPLIDPDTGKIHGFFVLSVVPGTERHLFLQSIDILSWGTKVHIRDAEHLSPPHELIRFTKAFAEPRTILGQLIRTRPGSKRVGRCADVQFDTKTFLIEWLFPRRCFLMRNPVPTTEIVEVTKNAIWIKNPLSMEREKRTETVETAPTTIPSLTDTPVVGRGER